MNRIRLSAPLAAFWLAICALLSYPSMAQTFPSRTIRIVVGYAPGGPADISARLLGNALGESIGQSVIVENKPGAAGSLAADMVAKSAPDGYTLLVSDSLTLMPSLFEKLSFDANKDFIPLSLIAIGPSVLVANPALPASNAAALIALAKSKPGQLKYGSAGTGSMGHLMMGLFASDAGIQLMHVPYKGGAPAALAVMSGEVDLLFTSIASVLPQIKAGRVKPYGLGLNAASGLLPNTPPISNSGLPGYNASSWQGLYAPARTPKSVVDFFNREIVKVMSTPSLREKFVAAGMDPVGNSSEVFAEFVKDEAPKWQRAIKASGVEKQ